MRVRMDSSFRHQHANRVISALSARQVVNPSNAQRVAMDLRQASGMQNVLAPVRVVVYARQGQHGSVLRIALRDFSVLQAQVVIRSQ